jgi:hypothetical protein
MVTKRSKKSLPEYALRHPQKKTWTAATQRTLPPRGAKPGEVRNPLGKNGKEKTAETRRVTHFLKQLLADPHAVETLMDETKRKEVLAEKLAKAAYIHAYNGDPSFFSQIMDRTEGKVPNPVELSGAGGAGVTFILDFSGKPDDTNGSS